MGEAIGDGESIFASDSIGLGDNANTLAGPANAFGSGLQFDASDLDLDSIVAASSPLPAAPAQPPAPKRTEPAKPPAPQRTASIDAAAIDAAAINAAAIDSDTFSVDLSGISLTDETGNSRATGSLVLGSGADAAGVSGSLIGAGSALSGALDSGLSLENDGAEISGMDLLMDPDDVQLGDSDKTNLVVGDDFELGETTGEEESGDIEIAQESGESSFLGGLSGESSAFPDDMPLTDGSPAVEVGTTFSDLDLVPETRFSVWQICGLICCSLLLLTGGFVMFDLVRTVGSPDDPSLSSPLLTPLADVFGWR